MGRGLSLLDGAGDGRVDRSMLPKDDTFCGPGDDGRSCLVTRDETKLSRFLSFSCSWACFEGTLGLLRLALLAYWQIDCLFLRIQVSHGKPRLHFSFLCRHGSQETGGRFLFSSFSGAPSILFTTNADSKCPGKLVNSPRKRRCWAP